MNKAGEVTKFGHAMQKHFLFNSKWTNLNHGSFGTYPLPVRNALRGYQELTEAAPDKFMFYRYIDLLDKSRERIASLINASVDDCVFVLNATTGVNTVLRNLTWESKDAIIYFDTVYSAVEKSLFSLREINPQVHLCRVGQRPDYGYSLPATHAEILNAFSQTVSRLLFDGYKPKVAVFDTIVSLPGVRFPFEHLTKICKENGILSLIDGAHTVGQIPIDMSTLDPDFFVSNCHKWLYTPRGCAVFYVPKRNQHLLRTTLPTSHGYIPPPGLNIRRVLPPSKKSAFVNLFQFVGTADNSPFYCVPAAMNFREKTCGGDEAIYEYMRNVAQRGADLLAKILGTEVMDDLDAGVQLKTLDNHEGGIQRGGPNPWAGGLRDCAMANVLLPIEIAGTRGAGSWGLGLGGANSGGGLPSELNGGSKLSSNQSSSPEIKDRALNGDSDNEPVLVQKEDVQKHIDWMHSTMTHEFNTRVLIYEYNERIWTRVSGQIYLELKDFEWLGGVLKGLCERVRTGESLQEVEHMPNGETADIDLEAIGRGVETVELESSRTSKPSITQVGWKEEGA